MLKMWKKFLFCSQKCHGSQFMFIITIAFRALTATNHFLYDRSVRICTQMYSKLTVVYQTVDIRT